MQKKTAKKRNMPMRIAGILLLFVLISAYATSGLYARYVTSAEESGSARVAKFDVTVGDFNGPGTAILTNTNTTETYSFTVSSNSEVSVEYDIILEVPAGSVVPDSVTFSIDGKTASVNGNIYTFSDNSWTFAAGMYEAPHEMTIAVSDLGSHLELNGIQITVIASQID